MLATATDNASLNRTLAFDPVEVTGVRLRFPFEVWQTPVVYLYEVGIAPAGPGGPVAGTAYLDADLADPFATEHRWQVAAVDDAGNESARSAAAIVDFRAPSAAIEAPAEGTPVGAPVQVSDGATNDRLNDIQGGRIVFTAYELDSANIGHIIVYDIADGSSTSLFPTSTTVREPRIHGESRRSGPVTTEGNRP